MAQPIDLVRRSGTNKKIGVIIQARMTSKRFPGKSLALLNGKPVLQHVIERCKQIKGPHKIKEPIKIIVAVPDTNESEPLLKLAQRCGVENFCGPEDNVLQRYYQAAKFFNLDVIVRITADCPLIEPKICSEVLQLMLWRKLDYVSNCHVQRTFPKGFDCEVFSFECLEATYITVKSTVAITYGDKKQKKYDEEHVTPLMVRHPLIAKALLKAVGTNSSAINLCVDYPADITRLERWIEKTKDGFLIKPSANDDKVDTSTKD